MDGIVSARPKAMSATEMERRRRIVRQADANNRLEGICREPATDAVVEAFIRGNIEVTDMVPLFKAQPGPR
jgi:U3 small nucleolar ribonucleoprotein component